MNQKLRYRKFTLKKLYSIIRLRYIILCEMLMEKMEVMYKIKYVLKNI